MKRSVPARASWAAALATLPARASWAAALAWVLVACTPLQLAAPPAPEAAARAADENLLDLVPGDAESVLFVDMTALRASPWTRPVLAQNPPRSGRVRGFDELADVDELVLAKVARAGAGAASLEILRGRFDFERVRDALAARDDVTALRQDDHRGRAIVGRGAEAFAFVTPRTLLWGPPVAVRAALDTAARLERPVTALRWYADARAALDDEAGHQGRRGTVEIALLVGDDVRAALRPIVRDAGAIERIAGRLDLGVAASAAVVALTPGWTAAASVAQQLANEARKSRRALAGLGLALLVDRLSIDARAARIVGTIALSGGDREALAAGLERLGEALESAKPATPPE